MTDGDATPAAERAAPKRAPEVVVARRFAIFAVLLCDASEVQLMKYKDSVVSSWLNIQMECMNQ